VRHRTASYFKSLRVGDVVGATLDVNGIEAQESLFIGELIGDAVVLLSGKAKTLTLGGIKGEASLDANALEAAEAVITGDLDGRGTLTLNVPGGSVTFLGSPDGLPRVTVHAPNGKATFGSADRSRASAGSIVGPSHVILIARDVDLRRTIDGRARVEVTLTEGGSPRFAGAPAAPACIIGQPKAVPGTPT
jgi:hypothetical protein